MSTSPVPSAELGVLSGLVGKRDRASGTTLAVPGLWRISSWKRDRYSAASTRRRFVFWVDVVVVKFALRGAESAVVCVHNDWLNLRAFDESDEFFYCPHECAHFKFGGPIFVLGRAKNKQAPVYTVLKQTCALSGDKSAQRRLECSSI